MRIYHVQLTSLVPAVVTKCYDQGLGEILVQRENETPFSLFPKHHQQRAF